MFTKTHIKSALLAVAIITVMNHFEPTKKLLNGDSGYFS